MSNKSKHNIRDIPVSRIKYATVSKVGDNIELFDVKSQSLLFTLEAIVVPFSYVAIVYGKNDEGRSVQRLMTVTSNYDFASANKRTLTKELGDKLCDIELDVIHIGIYYTIDGVGYVDSLPCSERLIINDG